MDIKPFFHKHYLLFDFYYNIEASCAKCHGQIYGYGYSCQSCPDFGLHEHCAEEQLPPQISHPLHTQHPLTLFRYRAFVCNQCLTLSGGLRYRCDNCNFQVDVSCAASTNEATLQRLESRLREIKHFVHEDLLTGPFNYRRVGKKQYNCVWCEKLLSGMSYCCLRCDLYIHESCLIQIPTKIVRHHFHSSHPLYTTRVDQSSPSCNVCKEIIYQEAYNCRKCGFKMHVLCARLKPSLKHEIHEHSLTYVKVKRYTQVSYPCSICGKNIDNGISIASHLYRCVQCDLNFHFGCLGIPSTTTHGYHMHSLEIVKHFEEDDLGEYYCDICEEKRNVKHYVYCCKKCKFTSHIQCTLNKVDKEDLIPKLKEQEETEEDNAESQSHDLESQIQHFSHQHTLNYYEVNEKSEDVLCQVCNLEIHGPAYGCESCRYYLHNRCTELSEEVLHPLHPQHPLQLSVVNRPLFNNICDQCKSILVGVYYVCYLCYFKLDLSCVTLTEPSDEGRRLKEVSRDSKLCPFNQDHELSFFNVRHKLRFRCSICLLTCSGSCYYCSRCYYYIHESCLGFPPEMALPLHPKHSLHPMVARNDPHQRCRACHADIHSPDIIYSCDQCEHFIVHNYVRCRNVMVEDHQRIRDIMVHLPCANSLLRALASKSHRHCLFYFGTECTGVSISEDPFRCRKCKTSVKGVGFYRCVSCDINFHLKCIPILQFIKCKRHIHRLILRVCFVEDDSGIYYCDICEEERRVNHHVYVCEECRGLFAAHIECVFQDVVEGIAPAEESFSNLVLDPLFRVRPKCPQMNQHAHMNPQKRSRVINKSIWP